MTKVSSYWRLIVATGDVQELPFADIDGYVFGERFERGEGVWYTRKTALEIVNRWNSLQGDNPHSYQHKFIYWIGD